MAAVFLLALPSLAVANGSASGIAGSPHDFTDGVVPAGSTVDESAWNFRGEICRVCHVPHDHNRNEALFTDGLLWDHQVSSETYEMYAESFPSFIDGAADTEPSGVSKLCLGCHDGTVGLDQYDNQTAGPPVAPFIGDYDGGFQVPGAGIANVGTDKNLRGTHPLSIVYDDVADPGLHNAATTPMGSSGNIEDVLWNGKVECSSCHDVHDSIGEAVASTHLLRVLNNDTNPSGLCLTCHDK